MSWENPLCVAPFARPPAHTHVLYHRDADGFASAFAAWCALGYEGVTYTSVQYGEPMPVIPDGARVFIVDFSYPRQELIELAQRTRELVVLDHHKTAAAELAGLACATFDMDKAGCQLAWDYFSNPALITERAPAAELLAEPLPWLLAAVADRDLWKFALPDTAKISAALELRKWDFDIWRALCDRDIPGQQAFIREGATCILHQNMAVKRMAKQKHLIGLRGEDGKPLVVIGCNTPLWQSECAHYLLKNNCGPVIACYAWEERGVRISLRGDGTVDVSEIAKRYEGGGGHHNAAGFFYPCALPNIASGETALTLRAKAKEGSLAMTTPFDWLDAQHEAALLTRQQRIAADIEHSIPIGHTDTEWLAHTIGKLMEERVATRNEINRLRAIEQEYLQGQRLLHITAP